MKRRTPRGLDPEERELWQRVAQTTTPLNRDTSEPKVHLLSAIKAQPTTGAKTTIDTFAVGAKSETALPNENLRHGPSALPGPTQIKMDRKAFQKLKRGKSVPEAKLDLHGMTVAAAHSALTAFILSAQAKGKRLVLVITGKGRPAKDIGPIPARQGVLRQQVPHWLDLAPLNSVVLQVSEAHQRHGGSGAYYVYLRRR